MTDLRYLISVVACGVMMLGACAMDEQDMSSDEEGVNLGSTEQAVVSGWTPYVSEEYPPVTCDSASLMSQVQCSGSYCDNLRAYCTPTGGSLGSSSWTTYFSEEPTNYRYCATGYWVTGFACQNKYCNNLSLQCSYIGGVSAQNCYWTGWVSEEGGGYLSFGAGYFARGVQCDGGYCDNKRFYVCQL